MHRSPLRREPILRAFVIGAAFFVLAAASILFTRFGGGVAFLWLATGPALAHFMMTEPKEWPYAACVVAVASWLSSSLFGVGPIYAIPVAVAAVGEALLTAFILGKFDRDIAALDKLGSVVAFVLVAGVVAPALSSIFGAAAATARFGRAFLPNWQASFCAHALGTITCAPLILMVMRGEIADWARHATNRGRIEAAILLIAVAATTIVAFAQSRMPLLFLPLLPLTVATFCLGRLGATSSVVVLTVIGSILTLNGHGPVNLIQGSIGLRAQFFQFYLAVVVLIVLPIAAELKRREQLFLRLQEAEAGHRLLTENIGDTLIHTDASGAVRFVSATVTRLTGYDASDVIGKNSRDFVIPEDLPIFEAARDQAARDPQSIVAVEYRAATRSRGIEWRETRMRSYVDERGVVAGIVLVVRDVHFRKVAEAELTKAARTDVLTGLLNRRAFLAQLDDVQRDVTAGTIEGCIALLDLDFFKKINDRYGHATGDTVLVAVADAASKVLRGTDMLARIGGEEFALVLRGANLEQATRTCERVRIAIANCRVAAPDKSPVSVSASIGVAELQAGALPNAAYEAADAALYAAKAAGRNCLKLIAA